ncbi:hypothetical protein M9Y10_038135 [Tritrichomonas musculus]|uniref:SHSP domain-containing protein n=1 Tax=Tritrichomonas musculus TaxID=1915356 RepID=A0ABR2K7K9_9EUKA
MLQTFSKIFKPRSNIYVNGLKMLIEYELPGVKKDDISIDCNESHLILKAKKRPTHEKSSELTQVRSERTFGNFERIFELPEEADLQNIDARLSDGVLSVTIPRKPSLKRQVVIN